ncbi:MAG: Glu/Leu/Phe/Val dehydrogenase [SAR202 cluster bacterium]|nr:Glu/Leu/Phe/Val dehydrogenase [SAR202 cluster bacterium]
MLKTMEYMERYKFEQFTMCYEPSVGLKAFIAIHSTTLGPSSGGVRIWPHPTEEDAIMDALRLARAMTYKSAVAGIPLGGGKGLIWADSRKDKNEAMLRAFGRFVDTLGGRYITTEDVGMTPRDLEHIAQETKYVVGLPRTMGGSGDTSEMTGLGLYLGMKACAKELWGSDSLAGKTIAMQGFGNVGRNTAYHLVKEGVKLVVADFYQPATEVANSLGATIVKPEEIYDQKADIFSPCALGAVINDNTIKRIKAPIICGGANNQLAEERHGEQLHQMGVLYAPDYVVNAGGIINASCEVGVTYNPDRAKEITQRIYDTTLKVFQTSKDEKIPTSVAADRMAERRIAATRNIKPMKRAEH